MSAQVSAPWPFLAGSHRHPLVSRDEHLAQDVGAVADDRIHPGFEQTPHDDRLVHCPRHNPDADVVRHCDEPIDEDRYATELDRHMCEGCGGQGPRWPHARARTHQQRGQRSPAQRRRDIGHLPVDLSEQPVPGTRNAHSFGNSLTLQGFHKRPKPSLILGVDRESLVGEGVECLVERRNRLDPVDPQGA